MNKINDFKHLVEESYRISSPLLLDTALQQISVDKESLIDSLKESGSVKVPIVGDFSSGKSSLLNAYLNRGEVLPVNITPETAVAYELYYSINEHAELFRDGEKIEERKLDDIKQFSTRPGDIAKVYINSSQIKDLELRGITLVDMPGIDSGIKEHNDAILNYINKGSVFILCVECSGGSLRQSTLSFITELSQYNLKPAILITKCDKKPAAELKDIEEYISFQARKALGAETFVGQVSSHQNNIQAFVEFLSQIDVEALMQEKFAARIKQYLSQQVGALNTQATVYSTSLEDVEKKIAALEEEKLKAQAQINESKAGDTPEKSTQDVLDLVRSTLNAHSSEIAQMAINKESSSEINARILNYIRPVIILAFKEEGEQYASAMNTVVDQVSTALQDNISIDGNIFDNLVDTFRDDIVGGISVAADILVAMPNVFAKALGWVLQVLGDKVPDLIKWFLGKSNDDILMEATSKVESSVIPQIIEHLRPEILQQITAQQQRIRNNMSEKISASIGNIQDSMMNSKETADKAELQAKIEKIKEAVMLISKLQERV